MTKAFSPAPASTVQISATTSSSRVALVGSLEQVRIVNAGAADAFLEFGTSTVAATVPSGATPGSMRIPAGMVDVVSPPPGVTHAAAITSSGTTTIDLTGGAGL